MKKVILSAGMLMLTLVMATSCGTADMEKRIADLERRVKELESKQSTSSTPANNASALANLPQATPVQTSDAAQPEPANEGPSANFNWSETHHDFGSISEGEVVKHVFNFTNTGEVPLIIERAQGSCGCTVPSYPKEPIPPGATGQIQVEFNSKGRTGVQNKTVTITANTEPKVSKLTIRSNVSPAG